MVKTAVETTYAVPHLKCRNGLFRNTTFRSLHLPLYICVWQHFVSRFTNFFITFFAVHECLAEWENILSNGFLYTNPRNLFYLTQLVRISMPYVKWVKIRDIFWYVMRMRSVPVKMTRFLHFWDSIFRKQSLILRKRLKIRVWGLFRPAHKILLNIPIYFLARKYAPVSQTFVYQWTVLKKIWKFWKS